jgi:hypothetical protein
MKSLLKAFQFVFGCRHRHQSRVFTIKHRTYRVCFDCGKEFDLPDAHMPMRSNAARGGHSETNSRHDR